MSPELERKLEALAAGSVDALEVVVDFEARLEGYLRGETKATELLADFDGYMKAQDSAEEAYRDTERWTRMSILNVARMGYFSSDRSIREYCRDIWFVDPMPIDLGDPA